MCCLICRLARCSILILGSVLLGCGPASESSADLQPVADRFLGSEACAGCHEQEYLAWTGSHHELAMQEADTDSILADFDDASLDYFGTSTEFLRDGGNYIVRTANADGAISDFVVTHTFGIEPLQQYLVELSGGRLQALPFAWDARPAVSGGQRWYHLYEDEYIGPGDPLHWTGRYFNWNFMCAECHSTNVRMGYDIATDSFDTRWDEISVGCEACHGPGAKHVQQAEQSAFAHDFGFTVDLDDRGDSAWIIDPESGIAALNSAGAQQQPESCGRCHSRRSALVEEYEYGKPLTDTHMPSLLEEHLYYADGRIQDEVYVYGSFLQSAMYRAGVTCGDCHDPHSANLITGPEPNDVCSQCHLPTVFATGEHSGTDSTSCVDCHMRSRTYMGVDDRRDHSFRLLETGPEHYKNAIAAGRAGDENGELRNALLRDYPAIVNATILTLLAPPMGTDDLGSIDAFLGSAEPLERIAALRAVRNVPPEQRLQFGSELLRDDVRGVRTEAVRTFVDLRDLLPLEDARAFAVAADEYRASLRASASMPESATMLAEFESRMGDERAADELLEHAVRLDAGFAPAVHARGLQRVRSGLTDLAIGDFRRAAELDPEVARYHYVLGVALNSSGRPDEALNVLRGARARFPNDFEINWGLATMLRDTGRIEDSRQIVGEMLREDPDNPNLNALMRSLGEQR